MSHATKSAAEPPADLWTQVLRESSRQISQLPRTHLVLLGTDLSAQQERLIALIVVAA